MRMDSVALLCSSTAKLHVEGGASHHHDASVRPGPQSGRGGHHAACVGTLSLGLRSTVLTTNAAFWASWADSLHMIQKRHPSVGGQILQEVVSSTRGRIPRRSCTNSTGRVGVMDSWRRRVQQQGSNVT